MRELLKRETLPTLENGSLESYAFPGGYPLVYQALSNNPYYREEVTLCPKCANDQEAKRKAPVCPECGSPVRHADKEDGDIVSDLDSVKRGMRTLVCTNENCYYADGLGKDDIAEYTVLSAFIHYEGSPIECETCNESIASAYGDPEEEKLFDRVRDVLRDDQEATTALLSALPVAIPLGYPTDQEANVLVYKTQPAMYSNPSLFEYHLTDEAVKRIVGTIGSMVPGFWERATNGASEEWHNDITFASVSMALKAIAERPTEN